MRRRALEGIGNAEGALAVAPLGMAAEEGRSRGPASRPWRARTEGSFKCGVMSENGLDSDSEFRGVGTSCLGWAFSLQNCVRVPKRDET